MAEFKDIHFENQGPFFIKEKSHKLCIKDLKKQFDFLKFENRGFDFH